ncbi:MULTISPECIES: PAS domain S-box protein [unclassified Coleofasciculus]|uniref:PAS domain S-box protein n=1 Tax=unclassified Coleofasciculus TaxID=2692782 RepID=UPI00187E0A83|nr:MULTISPECIES: PAS domain S-box protein [unclassified Coleofasciculus]MBE9126820.1 PAS domain S-box protein [Coleofasciculus sp. LEGE 07081]MBE9150191.1 PAS domain S-box protein [Coleofasciculus sp. LEGE 07092]
METHVECFPEDKHPEAALYESEERFRSAFKYAAIGMALVALDGRWLKLNRSLCKLLGYSQQELLAITFQYITHPDDLDADLNYVEQLLSGKISHYQMEKRYFHKQGRIIWILLSGSLVRDRESQPLYFIAQIQDISDRKQAETALKRAKDELEIRVEERTAQLRQALEQLQLESAERKKSAEALHESEQRYRSLVTATSQLVWITDPEGRTRGTSGWQAITGQNPEEAQGFGWVEVIHPDDRERTLKDWTEAIASKSLYETEYRLRTKGGSYRDFFARGVPILEADGSIKEWVGTSTDITDRKQAEEAQRKSEELYRTFARNFPNGAVLLFDRELRYILAEGTHLTSTGFTKEQLEGKTIREVLPPETYATLEPLYRSALAGETQSSEIPYADRIYQVHTLPVRNEQGEIFAGMLMSQDITVQKQAEQVLRNAKDELEVRVRERTRELAEVNASLQTEIAERIEAQQQLEQLAADLKRSNQELEQFAYVASHDLQEPLRAVTGYTQLLAQEYQDRFDESAQEYMGYVVDGATRMQQLIRDLLAYSRVGSRAREFAPVDCNGVLHQVLDNLQIAIAETNASITHQPLPTLIADNNQLVQLFQNLIGNAIKFNRKGELPQVHIEAQLNDGEWLFSVRDNGIGIKPQYLERIFIIFKRLHTRKEFSGTGIGLAICKKIVERHKGRIWVESQPGMGTTFYFTIPQAADSSLELGTNPDD